MDISQYVRRAVGAGAVAAVIATGLAVPTAWAQPGGIVISEIHYHAGSDLDTDDFLELANTSGAPIDVGGYSFSAGVTAVLPAGTVIPAGGYFVLSPSAASFTTLYGFAPDAIYTGKLSNSGEAVTLVDAAGQVVDTVSYLDAAPWAATPDGTGPSLELRGLWFDNTDPANWGASTVRGGTPKAVNSIDGTAPPPKVIDLAATPVKPAPGESVTISARLPMGSVATLTSAVMFDAAVTVPFLDDAASPGGAGDGVYAATIPGQAAGLLVRYRIDATLGATAFSLPAGDDASHYTGYTVANPAVTSALPVFEWFMADSVYNDLLANHRFDDVQGDAVIVYNGVVYDGAKMNIRGQFTRSAAKVQWKVDMPPGHNLDFRPYLPYTVDSWAMHYDVPAVMDLAWKVVGDTGAKDVAVTPIRTQRNGQFWSVGHFLQTEDGTWRGVEGVKNWSIYKADAGGMRTFPTAADLQASLDLEKKTRTDEDYTDVWTLTQKVRQASSAAQKQWFEENLNVPELINYMAINSIIRHWDSDWRNWYVARDTEGTGRWELWHWDLNNTFEPSSGDSYGDYLTPDRNNYFLTALLSYPDYRQMFFRRLRTLADKELPPGQLEAAWDAIVAPYKDVDWPLDRAKWGTATEATRRSLFMASLADRRAVIADNSGPGLPVPPPQSATPNVVINEIMYAPGGDGLAEYIEVANPSSESVDLSGWTLSGVGFTFQAGTVILPGARLVVVANDAAYRAAHPGSTNVAGQYSGRLADDGETVTLLQGTRVVDEVSYGTEAPWPAVAGTGSSLELLDPGLDNADPTSWVASAPGGSPALPNGGTPPADTTAPTAVTGLTGSATSTGVLLSWGDATDDRGVTAYEVRKEGNLVATLGVGVQSFADPAVAPGTTYTYAVRAVDRAGNPGPDSTASVLTRPTLVAASETFTAANSGTWPATWTTSVTAGGTVATTNNAGVLAVVDTYGSDSKAILKANDVADSEVLLSYAWNGTGPQGRFSVYLRAGTNWSDGARPSNGYGLEFTSTSTSVSMRRMSNAVGTTLASVAGGQAVSTSKQWLRARLVGSTLQFRTWLDGTAEPTTWKGSVTDSLVTIPGDLYVSLVRTATGTGTRTVTIDDVTVTSGQVQSAPDRTPPAAPTGLTAGIPTGTTVGLTWTAATDNIGVTGYDVLRDGVVVGSSTTTSFSDSGLTAETTYGYAVRAKDAAGNLSALSSAVSVTTPTPDTTPPSVPTGLAASGTTWTGTTLAWTAATDNVGVASYRVRRDGVLIGSPTDTSLQVSGLTADTTYSFSVSAVDTSGNESAPSAAVAVTTPAGVPPLFTDGFAGVDGSAWGSAWSTSVRSGSVTQSGGAGVLAEQDVASSYARAQLTGVAARADSEVVFSYTGTPASGHYLNVYLRGSGAWSGGFNPANGYGLEITNSTTVSMMKVVNGTQTKTSIANGQVLTAGKQWVRVRVVGSTFQFRTWLDGQPEPSTWKGTVTDTAVTAPGQLYLSLARSSKAGMGAGTVKIDDLVLTDGATAPPAPDTQAPSVPGSLTATGTTATGTTLSWSASSDNVGVTGYRVTRNGSALTTTSALTVTDSGLTASTTYTYAVSALDAAGNESAAATVTVTTPAATAALFTDGFAGVDGSAWGSAWSTSVRSGSVTQSGGAGVLAEQDVASSYARAQLTGVAARADSEVVFSYTGTPASGHYLNVYLRGSGAWSGGFNPANGYGLEITNSTTVSMMKVVNGTQTKTSIANGQVLTAGKQWVRVRVVGSTFQFRTWLDGQPEPSTWKGTVTDTAVTAPGQLYLSLARSSKAGMGAGTVKIDDLQLTSGQ
ncbi:MAG: lamin tail domain-containing protein [Actinomycetales bacterium]|nr:lamin tail domain-containing protein [Actinomycetales bacterium]